jgi:integrase
MSTTTMTARVEEYLAYRRARGYQIRAEAQRLQSFARYADDSGHQGPLTTELALQWARLPGRSTRLDQARRLEVVRTLARYLAPREPGPEIPPRGLLGPAHARGPAFLYAESDIAALITAARSLAPIGGLRPLTYATLIGLLACTGLRITEALTLRADDVDLQAGVLTIRRTKFRKSRLVPLHASAVGPRTATAGAAALPT